MELVQRGRATEAEALLRGEVSHTRDGSPERTDALFDLANLLVACGDLPRAVEPLRTAVAMPPVDREHEKARLTGTMNLGEILGRLGEIEEAHAVLKDGLEARRAFYGENHAGFAYGLESLAKVEMQRGDVASALDHINTAVRIFWDAGNERIASCFATRAPIVKATGTPAFDQLEALPDELFDRMVSDVLQADDVSPRLQLDILGELAHVVSVRDGAAAWLPQVHASLSNTARDAGNHLARIKSLEWLRAHMERIGDFQQALGMVLALALAQDEAGNTELAEAHYTDAIQRANDPRSRARAGRNFGLFLSQHERPAEARVQLQAALAAAREAGDPDELGQIAVAHGIFLQHQKDRAAEPLLEEAIRVLSPDHPDALCARSHLIALRTGGGCGCGDMSEALASAVLDMIREAVPGGLVADLEITLPEGAPPNVSVQLAREPSPAEVQALDSAVHLAVAHLQQSIRRRGLAPAG